MNTFTHIFGVEKEKERRLKVQESLKTGNTRGYHWLDSNWYDYISSFTRLFSDNSPLKYLDSRFSGRKINALDLGGAGNILFHGLTHDEQNPVPLQFGQTAGVDLNGPFVKPDDTPEHKSRYTLPEHKNIIADAFSKSTFRQVQEVFPKGVDLIISRMGAGLKHSPDSPELLFRLLNNYYQILNVGGALILQLPVKFAQEVKKWQEYLQANQTKGLNFKFSFPEEGPGSDSRRGSQDNLCILIEKNEDAPNNLPSLPTEKLKL